MSGLWFREASPFVDVVDDGTRVLLVHERPGSRHYSLLPFGRLADRFTLVFYDRRCDGRSVGPPVTSMTWENRTAGADALRERPEFECWA